MQTASHFLATTPVVVPRPPETILIIDDDAAMRLILSFSATSFGYLTLLAGGGEEALQIARDHPEVRVIVLDVVMSGLSGKALADQLMIHLPRATILFCSGHMASILSRYDIDAASVHFIRKPFGSPEFKQKLADLLST